MINIQVKLMLRDQGGITYSRHSKSIPVDISIKLVPTHFPQQQKIENHDICKALEYNLACYIPIHNQSNYIHG